MNHWVGKVSAERNQLNELQNNHVKESVNELVGENYNDQVVDQEI